MKLFFQRSGKVTHFSNIFASLLCTSSLFLGYSNIIENNDEHEKANNMVINDTEEVSQTGTDNIIRTAVETKKATAVVMRKKVNTSNKNYTPAKYNAVTGQAIIDYAMGYIGLRYVNGGYSLEKGTDCSGFTKLIYQEFGVTLSRSVKYQSKSGSYIKKRDLQKGDLVFYGYGDGVIHHVAIYIGNGQVIHESNKQDGVKISSVNMMEYIVARRVINDDANKIVEEKNKIIGESSSCVNDECINEEIANDSNIKNDEVIVNNEDKNTVVTEENIDNQSNDQVYTQSNIIESSN